MKNILLIILILILSACGKQSIETAEFPKIIAHRGFSGAAPENTLSAFQKALDIGADYFELDVHISADDSLIVIHDKSIDRTSTGGQKGLVAEMNYSELKLAGAAYPEKFGQQFKSEPMPTLFESLAFAKGKPIKVCVEIKVQDVESQVMDVINKLNMGEQVIIFSFHRDVLEEIRRLDPDIPMLFLRNYADESTLKEANEIGANAVGAGYDTRITPELIQKAHESGLELWKWTVNGKAQMKDLFDVGIDGIITNYPDSAMMIMTKS